MAKLVGLVGTGSGKVGNFVLSKGANGKTIAKAYQPTVANPKTMLQTVQRAKMNLVGRMSKVTPANVLTGFGKTKVERRSAFNRNLMEAASVESSAGVVIAKIAPADVVFSSGNQVPKATVSTPVAVTASSVTLGLTMSDSQLVNLYGERIIVAVVDPSDKAGYSLVVSADVVFDSTTEETMAISMGAPMESGSQVNVYRVPFMLTDEGAAIRMQTLANDGTDIIAKALLSENLVRSWGNSVLSSSTVFQAA